VVWVYGELKNLKSQARLQPDELSAQASP